MAHSLPGHCGPFSVLEMWCYLQALPLGHHPWQKNGVSLTWLCLGRPWILRMPWLGAGSSKFRRVPILGEWESDMSGRTVLWASGPGW